MLKYTTGIPCFMAVFAVFSSSPPSSTPHQEPYRVRHNLPYITRFAAPTSHTFVLVK